MNALCFYIDTSRDLIVSTRLSISFLFNPIFCHHENISLKRVTVVCCRLRMLQFSSGIPWNVNNEQTLVVNEIQKKKKINAIEKAKY